MYEDFETDDGLSILELIRLSFGINKKRRTFFGICSLSIAIVLILILQFVYNGTQTSYSSSFDYQIPSLIVTTTEEGLVTNVTYLDGTPFNINSVVTLSNLKRAKNSSDEFKSIDVDEIYNESEVSASKNEEAPYPFTISIKKKYFEDEEQAKKFFEELIRYPLIFSHNLVESTNNSAYLVQARKEGASLDEEINNLIYQSEYIIDTYEKLAEDSPDVYVTYNGQLVKFNELKNISKSRIDSLGLTLLLSEVESNSYVRNLSDPKVKEAISIKYENLKAEASKLQNVVDNYKSMLENISVINENQFTEFIKAVDRKAVVDNQVKVYEGYNDPTKAKDSSETGIEDELIQAIDELESITNILTSAQKRAYSDAASAVYYETNKVVSKTGNLNIFLVIAISIVAGILISSVINIIISIGAYKNAKANKLNNAISGNLNNKE